jgi:Glyoxalase-like domain
MLSWADRMWWHDGLDDDPAGYTMTAQLVALAFDAMAPNELARFWGHALRWQIREADGVGVELEPTDATSFSLLFQPVAHAKVGQNRIHFDLTTTSVDDQNDTVAELLAIGATHIDIGQGPNDAHIVLADPESNEFCIIEPHNRFLASCPRLGAVNCDGTRALGCFFSEALGWPLVWDQDEETAIQAPDGTGPKITWSGPPLMPKSGKERIHFHIAPTSGISVQVALDHLLALGATQLGISHAGPGAMVLADVDGNEVCLVDP